ncbi:hypothetical protein BH11VER1_BH11VER1_36980 [soil metagenome]
MNSSPDTSQVSGTRRRIVAWGGVGVLATLAGYLGWPRQEKGAVPAVSKLTVKSATGNASQALSDPAEPAPIVALKGRDVFLPHVESEFRLEYGPLSVTKCKLIEVGALQTMHSAKADFTSYSLLFTASKDFVPESRMYHLSHEVLGTMDLFLSPIGKSKERVYLEAIISQRV